MRFRNNPGQTIREHFVLTDTAMDSLLLARDEAYYMGFEYLGDDYKVTKDEYYGQIHQDGRVTVERDVNYKVHNYYLKQKRNFYDDELKYVHTWLWALRRPLKKTFFAYAIPIVALLLSVGLFASGISQHIDGLILGGVIVTILVTIPAIAPGIIRIVANILRKHCVNKMREIRGI